LHLDNDLPGKLASKAIRTVMNPAYHVRDAPPPSGKDCNEYLLSRLGRNKIQKERSYER